PVPGTRRARRQDRGPVRPIQLEAPQRRQRVLIRHRDPAEGLALVAEITRRIDAIEAEEAALRPGPYRGRKDGERAPSCASKIVDQRPALAEHEALPAALIVDPQTRKERRMREPALPSADRCAHPSAACTEAGGHSRLLELG